MSTTLAQLREQTLQYADMSGSNFIAPAELDRSINNSGGELWDILITRYEDYTTTPGYTQFSLTGSIFQYQLPDDCVKLRGIDWQDGSGWVPLSRYTLEERRRWETSQGLGFLWNARTNSRHYTQLGSSLSFVPEDNAAGTYRFRYVKSWTPMTASADFITLPNGWDEYIAIDAAIKCLQKEESDTAALQMRKAALLKRIEGAASNRDASAQDFVIDPTGGGWRW